MDNQDGKQSGEIIEHEGPVYDQVSGSGKRYYLGVYEGKEARYFESGAVQDPVTGIMLKPFLTRENAAEIGAKRWSDVREQARAAIVKKAEEMATAEGWDMRMVTAEEAFGLAIGIMYEDSLDRENNRLGERIKALELVGKLAGLVQDGRTTVKLTDSHGNSFEGDLEGISSALEYFQSGDWAKKGDKSP